MLVSGGYDQSIVVWDVENCVQKLRLQGHTDWITGVDISTDQNWLLSCAKVSAGSIADSCPGVDFKDKCTIRMI